MLEPASGNRSHDHRRAVFIAGIILNDQNRTDAALLAPDNRGEVRIENITFSNLLVKHLLLIRQDRHLECMKYYHKIYLCC